MESSLIQLCITWRLRLRSMVATFALYRRATGFVLSLHSVLLLAQRADVIKVSLLNIVSQ